MSSTIIVNKPPLRLPSILYGLHSGPGGRTRSAAAIGLLGSASFDLPHVYQVSLVHRGAVVGSRTWKETWTGMAVHGDLLAVYRAVRQFSTPHYQVCRVSPDHQITTLWNYEDFPATIHDAIGTGAAL